MAGEPTIRLERSASISSSSAETATNEENEKLARLDQSEEGLEKMRMEEDAEAGDREDDGLLPRIEEKTPPPKSTFTSSLIWMIVNTLATIGIVRKYHHVCMILAFADLTLLQ
jgi:solute carrier family 35 protein E3